VTTPRPTAEPATSATDPAVAPTSSGPLGDPVPVARRRRRGDRVRATRLALWSLVVLCAGTYAASLLVPLWYQVQEQRLLIVTSGSMAPSFRAGDAVVLQHISDPSQLRPGQVVSFWPPGSDDLVTHRIQDLRTMPVLEQDVTTGRMVPVLDASTGEPVMREHLITQGDANDTRDPDAVPVTRVRGVVLDVHAKWGAVLSWTHSDVGRLVMLGPPLLALAGMEIATVVHDRRRRRLVTAGVARDHVRAHARRRSDELLLG
jgi:signal peptidase I